MPEWSVRLEGDELDLEKLSKHLISPDLNVSKEQDGHYYLKASGLASAIDDDDRYERAIALIEHINGAAKLLLGDYFPVEYGGLYWVEDDGRRYQTVSKSLRVEWQTREEPRSASPQEVESLVTLAEQDWRLAEALRFFLIGGWSNLYKAWEIIISEAAKGQEQVVKKGWTTRGEKSRFTQTAQSRKVLGDEARHANDVKYPPPSNPMSLTEARTFVRSLIESWIQEMSK